MLLDQVAHKAWIVAVVAILRKVGDNRLALLVEVDFQHLKTILRLLNLASIGVVGNKLLKGRYIILKRGVYFVGHKLADMLALLVVGI